MLLAVTQSISNFLLHLFIWEVSRMFFDTVCCLSPILSMMMIPLFAAHLPVIVSPMLLLTAGPQPQPQYAVAMQTQREPHSFTNPQYANPTAYTEYYAKDTRPLI